MKCGTYSRPAVLVRYLHIECRACGWEDAVPGTSADLARDLRRRHELACAQAKLPWREWARPPKGISVSAIPMAATPLAVVAKSSSASTGMVVNDCS